jgi:hypothetical protein
MKQDYWNYWSKQHDKPTHSGTAGIIGANIMTSLRKAASLELLVQTT